MNQVTKIRKNYTYSATELSAIDDIANHLTVDQQLEGISHKMDLM